MMAACIMNIFAKLHEFLARMNKQEGQSSGLRWPF